MKSKLLLLLLFFIGLFESCKKEAVTNSQEVNKPAKPNYIDKANVFLKNNYTAGSLNDISIDASALYKLDSGRYVIRVPLKNNGAKNFILLSADSVHGITKSVLLDIDKTSNTAKGERFNGTITIKEINGKLKEIRNIVNGFKVLNNPAGKVESYVLPEVIVVSYVYNYSFGWADWYNLLDLLGGGGYNDWYGFNYAETTTGGGGGGAYSPDPNAVQINFDVTTEKIDLLKYLNCFNQVSDLGATYSVKICAQLPIDNDPWPVVPGLATGHAFLSVTKTNGGNSITQNFGFYPESGPKSLALTPVPSKLGDNDFTKYNASLTVSTTYDQFSTFMQTAMNLSTHNYDINDYNCANFALDCFNSVRGANDKLTVPNTIRGLINYHTTPNGIYELLHDKKNNNDPEASNIDTGINHSSFSHGPCN